MNLAKGTIVMNPRHALVFRSFGELSVAAGYILVVFFGLYEDRTLCAIEETN